MISNGVIILFILFGLLAFIVRFFSVFLDKDRVREYIETRGGKVIETSWSPFGKGWFGEESARIYTVSYIDKEGNQRRATCKTRTLGGVYWTEDNIEKHAGVSDSESLKEENAILRAEIDRLKGGGAKPSE